MGSQSEVTTPGNNGQITVTEFSPSGKGKLKIRFAPAREPSQTADVSDISYRMYVIPYQGSYDPQIDFSPYTACGVLEQGYSVYNNDNGLEYISYNPEDVIKNGYLEVESNLDLWQNDTPSGTVLYVTVIVQGTSYTGVLVGDDSMSMAALMTITLTITVIIAASLFVMFWALFIRVKSIKAQGYKAVIV